MKLIKEISDTDSRRLSKIRSASRAVLFDENNKIPLLFVSKYSYHKLPGGGLGKNEDKIMGLVREVKEETGCDIKIYDEVGRIIEFRYKYDLKQTSYCYIGKIIKKGKQSFTKKELREGFKLVWVTIDEAISLLKKDNTKNYEGDFIIKRDLEFLKEAIKFVGSTYTDKSC